MRIQENGCSMLMFISIEEKSIYLAEFQSIHQGMGNFTDFLKKHIGLIKENYPNYLVYADCNSAGTGVAVKAGGRVKETLNRVIW
jgi:transposase-like protein